MKGFHRDLPVERKLPPQWSLEKVLEELKKEIYSDDSDTNRLLLKALFLIALGTGWRVSTLSALLRVPDFCRFDPNLDSVYLLPSPNFISKRENPANPLKGMSIPAWKIPDGSHHPLCPVFALKKFIKASGNLRTEGSPLWIHNLNQLRPTSVKLSRLICELVEIADPGKYPQGHDVRKFATTLAYIESGNTQTVTDLGQWASSFCVKYHYFLQVVKSTNCVAMGIQTHDVCGRDHLLVLGDD